MFTLQNRPLTFLTALTVTAHLTGCGLQLYEERLQASAEFNEYIQSMEANLVTAMWEASGIKMRLPLPFNDQIPRPPILKDEEGREYYGPDERHPQEMLGIVLPGIIDAWTANLPGDGGIDVESRIYVLSNQYRFETRDGAYIEDPTQFLNDVEAALALTYNVIVPEGEQNDPGDNFRYRATFPPPKSQARKFATPKDYTVIRFISAEPILNQRLQAQLYEHQVGELQVAILIIGPESFTPRFRQRIEMALQTLTVDPNAASQDKPGSGGSSGRRDLGF